MKFPVLWLYLERATSLLVIDDYYVPPSINKVYTIYTKKLLSSDWLRKECKMCNLSAKCVIQCKLHIEILDYDWLMNNRVWSGLLKSFLSLRA